MVNLFSLLLVLGGGMGIALVIRSGFSLLPTAVLISGGLALIAGILHILIDVPVLALWWVFVLGGTLALLSFKKTRQRIVSNLKTRWKSADYMFFGITVAVVSLYSFRIPAPVGWDARSIWFFHASWLTGPAKDYIDGFSMGLIWPDYPILGPSSIALVWGHLGGENLPVGSFIILILSLAALTLCAYYLQSAFSNSVSIGVRLGIFSLLLLAGATLANGMIATGYQDVLQAALIGLLISGLLASHHRQAGPGDMALLGVWAFLAVNVKQEGFWFAVVILAAYYVASFRQIKFLDFLPLFGAIAGKLSWWAVLQINDAPDSGSTGGLFQRLPELLDFESTGWSLIGDVMQLNGWGYFTPLLLILALAVVGPILLKRAEPGSVAMPIFFLLSWLGLVALIVLTYALGDSRNDLEWWLGTSFSRIVATPDFLVWICVGSSALQLVRRTNYKISR
jgi:hypothetical protein